MSIFGSRDDDPLLQGDPFAPTSDDDPDDEARGDEHEGEEADPDTPHTEGSVQPNRRDASASDAGASKGGSVFGNSDDGQARPRPAGASAPAEDGARVVVRLVEEAADGHLDRLNTAIEAGWRLQRVELLHDDEDERQSVSTSRSIAFVLQKPDS